MSEDDKNGTEREAPLTDVDIMHTNDVVRALDRMMRENNSPVVTVACTSFPSMDARAARGDPPTHIIVAGGALVPMRLFDEVRRMYTELQIAVGELLYEDAVERGAVPPSQETELFVREDRPEPDATAGPRGADKTKLH